MVMYTVDMSGGQSFLPDRRSIYYLISMIGEDKVFGAWKRESIEFTNLNLLEIRWIKPRSVVP